MKPARDESAAHRQTMIDSQLRTVGVSDARLLAAFDATPREPFVVNPRLAYADAGSEVAPGRWLLEPLVLALLLEHAEVTPGTRALVVGAATGYSAAILARLGARVTALEIDPDLSARAALALAETPAATPAVTLAAGPLAAGWPQAAPYDLILFEGAIEVLPESFAAQLAPGGRVAAVVRDDGVGRAAVGPLVTGPAGPRVANGPAIADGPAAPGPRIAGQPFLEVAARPLPGFARRPAFAF